MKVNIVTEKNPGWVLRWISESYSKYIPKSTVSTKVDKRADINFYVNYDLFIEKTNTIDVGYFTHKERIYPKVAYEGYSAKEKEFMIANAKKRAKHFDEVAKKVDWCISMNHDLVKELPKNKTSTLLIPPDPRFMKGDIVIGWVGRPQKTGRKNTKWIDEINRIDGISLKVTIPPLSFKKMPDFYRSIDYLLIYSQNEGGPLPLVEALAMGVPVISNNVGFVSEYTTLRYDNFNQLKDLLRGLVIKKDAWKESSNELIKIFKNLIASKKSINIR